MKAQHAVFIECEHGNYVIYNRQGAQLASSLENWCPCTEQEFTEAGKKFVESTMITEVRK
jgi:hypothetical protein